MPSPEQRVSEYILESKLGAGSFGEVWKARHHVWSDRFVAVKIPLDPSYLKNLRREGAVIHGLMHPNIVRAMGFDPYADPPYLTMEYIPGSSLRPFVSGKTLKGADVVTILKAVLTGLDYAHRQGIVHQDVKPENVLIHERWQKDGFAADGVVKVTDFGLGRATSVTAVGSIVYSASLDGDAAKEIAGSLDYMSPEQRGGGEVDGRADLWACGVMLFEMLTGERPAGTDLPSDINPKVPRELDDVFKRAYARIDKRFKTAAEFIEALDARPAPQQLKPADVTVTDRQSITPKVAGPMITCPDCAGNGKKPGADFNFCDQCHGRGKLSGRMTDGRGEVEVDCGKCRGRGYLNPEKCTTCHGRGVIAAPHPAPAACPSCRRAVEPGDQFCMHCGVQLVQQVKRCKTCGAFPEASDRFCIFCGETLAAAAVVA